MLFYFTLAPFKGSRLFIVNADEVIDCLVLFDIDKAGSLERLAAQYAKPAFNLIRP